MVHDSDYANTFSPVDGVTLPSMLKVPALGGMKHNAFLDVIRVSRSRKFYSRVLASFLFTREETSAFGLFD
jgi:hypothetical protein